MYTLQEVLALATHPPHSWRRSGEQEDLKERHGKENLVDYILTEWRKGNITNEQVKLLNDWMDAEELTQHYLRGEAKRRRISEIEAAIKPGPLGEATLKFIAAMSPEEE